LVRYPVGRSQLTDQAGEAASPVPRTVEIAKTSRAMRFFIGQYDGKQDRSVICSRQRNQQQDVDESQLLRSVSSINPERRKTRALERRSVCMQALVRILRVLAFAQDR
jgi:hypothetical protein